MAKVNSQLLWILVIILISACQKDNTDNFIPPEKSSDWKGIFVESLNDLNDVYFVNPNFGWIVGENRTLFSTSSGDLGWNRAPVDFPIEDINSVFFINEETGWMAGNLSETTPKGQVAISTMGGGYPTQQFVSENPLNTVLFVDELNGWAAGENGMIIRTIDGGTSWTTMPVFTNENINDIFFINDKTGWAATANGNIFQTTDGDQWMQTPTGITTDLLAIHFVDENGGWACGLNNTILKWERGEENTLKWIEYTIEMEARNMIWADIFFVDSSTGWIIGEFGRIYKTTDGGITWVEEISPTDSDLNAIYMVSKDKGWIVGNDGVIISYNPG